MNINDINATLGNDNNTISANVPNINYIPGYKIAEEERRANEAVRQTNEASRITLYNDMESKLANNYFNGATFIPSVSESGEISWTNDKELDNPTTRNIKGPKGDPGDKGDKGDKGDPGAIKFSVVESLPATGADDTIYLVPITPDTSGNNYAEYIYINGAWELLGKIGVQVDLTNYVTNTDYATTSVGGVIKTSGSYGNELSSGVLRGTTRTYPQYTNDGNGTMISKGTLENVITGKDLTTKSYVDGLVGDIARALNTINGENI